MENEAVALTFVESEKKALNVDQKLYTGFVHFSLSICLLFAFRQIDPIGLEKSRFDLHSTLRGC